MTNLALLQRRLPSNQIEFVDGRVTKYSVWVNLNGHPWEAVVIERRENEFWCSIGDPGEKRIIRGTINEVAAYFMAPVGARIKKLFALDEPTGKELRELGFL